MNKKLLVLKRKVKYIRLEINPESLKLITPENFKINPNDILEKHQKWLQDKIEKLNEIKKISETLNFHNQENLSELINSYIEEIGRILKVKPNKVLFRKMKIRWGSCHHEKRIIIFNKLLKYLPEDLIRYVVLHEMCHLIFRNHKKEFWLLIRRFDPHFREKEKLLAGYIMKLIQNCEFCKRDNKIKDLGL